MITNTIQKNFLQFLYIIILFAVVFLEQVLNFIVKHPNELNLRSLLQLQYSMSKQSSRLTSARVCRSGGREGKAAGGSR